MGPLAYLEGRPIHVGDTLYDLDDQELEASTTSHCDFSMAMIIKSSVRGNVYRSWLTDTHWRGQQVIFWSPEDIPPTPERTLHWRLKDQLAKRAERKRRGL